MGVAVTVFHKKGNCNSELYDQVRDGRIVSIYSLRRDHRGEEHLCHLKPK